VVWLIVDRQWLAMPYQSTQVSAFIPSLAMAKEKCLNSEKKKNNLRYAQHI